MPSPPSQPTGPGRPRRLGKGGGGFWKAAQQITPLVYSCTYSLFMYCAPSLGYCRGWFPTSGTGSRACHGSWCGALAVSLVAYIGHRSTFFSDALPIIRGCINSAREAAAMSCAHSALSRRSFKFISSTTLVPIPRYLEPVVTDHRRFDADAGHCVLLRDFCCKQRRSQFCRFSHSCSYSSVGTLVDNSCL